jgi:hypothetical protein
MRARWRPQLARFAQRPFFLDREEWNALSVTVPLRLPSPFFPLPSGAKCERRRPTTRRRGSVWQPDNRSGEFSFKITSLTFTPGPANSTLVHANCEGTATDFGTLLFTSTFMVGKSGTHSWCGAAYLDNGDILTYTGQGTHESKGRHQWRTHGMSQGSDGRTVVVEGEIDLAARTWRGRFGERS